MFCWYVPSLPTPADVLVKVMVKSEHLKEPLSGDSSKGLKSVGREIKPEVTENWTKWLCARRPFLFWWQGQQSLVGISTPRTFSFSPSPPPPFTPPLLPYSWLLALTQVGNFLLRPDLLAHLLAGIREHNWGHRAWRGGVRPFRWLGSSPRWDPPRFLDKVSIPNLLS